MDQEKADRKLKALEDFLEKENIKNYFVTGVMGDQHFTIVNGPVSGILVEAFKGLNEADPNKMANLMIRLFAIIEARVTAELEGQGAVIH